MLKSRARAQQRAELIDACGGTSFSSTTRFLRAASKGFQKNPTITGDAKLSRYQEVQLNLARMGYLQLPPGFALNDLQQRPRECGVALADAEYDASQEPAESADDDELNSDVERCSLADSAHLL